jgi:hypothetical protein
MNAKLLAVVMIAALPSVAVAADSRSTGGDEGSKARRSKTMRTQMVPTPMAPLRHQALIQMQMRLKPRQTAAPTPTRNSRPRLIGRQKGLDDAAEAHAFG